MPDRQTDPRFPALVSVPRETLIEDYHNAQLLLYLRRQALEGTPRYFPLYLRDWYQEAQHAYGRDNFLFGRDMARFVADQTNGESV